jgi:hypothetical protein
MSFKFGSGLIALCEDDLGGYNPRDRVSVLLKPAWSIDKELDRMGVARIGLLTYDCKST